jgi:acyl dehydratase
MRTVCGAEGLRGLVGEDIGVSPWLVIGQDRIDQFAHATNDTQWIHVDIDTARRDGPYGGTIAHGFLTLSLIPYLTRQNLRVDGLIAAVNYGLDRVRFPAPVRSGSRIRGATHVVSATGTESAVELRLRTTVEVEGTIKPACVADTIARYSFDAH